MTAYVVDASVAAEYLLRTSLGLTIANTLEGAQLMAPELLDVEVFSVLRRAVLTKKLQKDAGVASPLVRESDQLALAHGVLPDHPLTVDVREGLLR